jgi:hypothetical protein
MCLAPDPQVMVALADEADLSIDASFICGLRHPERTYLRVPMDKKTMLPS